MTVPTRRRSQPSLHPAFNGVRQVVRRAVHQYPTNRIERILLLTTVVTLPLESHLPTIAGFSIAYIIFVVLAGYVMLNRPRALSRTWMHPVFLAAYGLLTVGCLVELIHPYSSYYEIFQIGKMVSGAIFVASLCRDRQALRAGIYGYLIAGVWMSVLVFLLSYGALQGRVANDFGKASEIRNQVFKDNPKGFNLNGMSYIAAEGLVVALALALHTKTPFRRNLFVGITLFCLVGTFLPMSRSGIVIASISCAVIMLAYGANIKVIIMALVLGTSIPMLVPDAVFARLSFSAQGPADKLEARARIYTAAVEHLPEYVMTGIGAGNFWEHWGKVSGFGSGKNHAMTGSHNVFIQITIYWGLIGFLVLLAVIWQAYRCLPKRCGEDALSLGLLGIATSMFLIMFTAHDLYHKSFSLILGMLVGAGYWIWPQSVVSSGLWMQRRLYRTLRSSLDNAPSRRKV